MKLFINLQINLQSLSCVRLFETPWTAHQASLSITNSWSSLKPIHWVGEAIQPSQPLSLPSPPALIFPSIRVFSNESALRIRWPKYWSFNLSITMLIYIPSNEYSGLISFRIDWFKLLAVQGTARRSNQSIRKDINPEWSLEGLMLKLKLQYFGHLTQRTDSLKDHDAGKDWQQEEKGTTEDETVGWHQQLNGHKFEQSPGVGEGWGSLVCSSPFGSQRVRHD